MRLGKTKTACASQYGFTLMEILVATTIFAFVAVALTSLFNYTLKINRRAEALRQVTQGMRNFTEYLVKEIRNGQVDYSVANTGSSNIVLGPIGPCYGPASSLAVGAENDNSAGTIYGQTAIGADNKLGIITPEGDRECIYLVDASGNAVAGFNGQKLRVNKNNMVTEDINPDNFTVDYLVFRIRPVIDPYTDNPIDSSPKIQPSVSISAKFSAQLPTGEKVSIYYQTSVSTDKYDVPGTASAGPSYPLVIKTIPMSGNPWSVYALGNYAYVGTYGGDTLYAYDISDPYDPVFQDSTSQNLNLVWDVFVLNNYAYTASFNNDTLAIFDVSNPSNIVPRGTSSTNLASPNKIFVQGNYAYVLNKLGLFSTYNISDPDNIVALDSLDVTGGQLVNNCRGMYVSGNYAYATCDTINKLITLDISNPNNIVYLTSITTNLETPYAVYVSGNYAYVANWSITDGLAIFDVTDPSNPIAKDAIASGVNYAQGVVVQGSYAYVVNSGDGTLSKFDVSDVNDIALVSQTVVGSVGNSDNAVAISVYGNFAYVPNYFDNTLSIVRLN